jgi:hypothetical protein
MIFFFTEHVYIQLEVDEIFTANIPDHRKLRFIRIIKLPYMVSN